MTLNTFRRIPWPSDTESDMFDVIGQVIRIGSVDSLQQHLANQSQ